MLGLAKKGFLLTLGATVLAMETMEKVANLLVEKGEDTKNEATKTAKEAVKGLKKDVIDVQKMAAKKVEKISSAVGVASLNKHKNLEKRVKSLEETQKISQI